MIPLNPLLSRYGPQNGHYERFCISIDDVDALPARIPSRMRLRVPVRARGVRTTTSPMHYHRRRRRIYTYLCTKTMGSR